MSYLIKHSLWVSRGEYKLYALWAADKLQDWVLDPHLNGLALPFFSSSLWLTKMLFVARKKNLWHLWVFEDRSTPMKLCFRCFKHILVAFFSWWSTCIKKIKLKMPMMIGVGLSGQRCGHKAHEDKRRNQKCWSPASMVQSIRVCKCTWIFNYFGPQRRINNIKAWHTRGRDYHRS